MSDTRAVLMKQGRGVISVLAVVFLHSQCIQGTLYHFNNNGHRNTKHHFEKYIFSGNDAGVDELSLASRSAVPVRARRQNMPGANPKAYTSSLSKDTHLTAQTFYLGGDSKVNYNYIAIL